MLIDYKRGQTSVVLRVKLLDSAVTTGAGKTGLTEASAGLRIAAIANNEATSVAYAAVSSEIETITTLGTYAAPSSNKCRFKEVDATNHPGIYEIHLADARFAVSSAKSLLVSISATGVSQCDALIPLRDVNPYDAVRFGMTALPNAAADAAGGLPISDAGGLDLDAQLVTKINDILVDTGTTLQAEVDGIQADTEDIQARLPAALTADGNIKADTLRVGGTLQTAGDIIGDTNDIQARLPAALVSGRIDASVGAMAANVITAAAAAGDLTTELQSGLATAAAVSTLQTSVDDVPTNAELATALGTADDAVLARLGAPAGASVSADIAAVHAKTTNLPASPAAVGSAMTLTSAYDLYHADIQFTRDQANTQDEYTVTWFKNGVRQTSGITSPTIQVIKRADGTNLIGSTAMTQIGSTGSYKHDATTTARLTVGESALVVVTATIDSSSRTFSRVIGRDST